MKKWSERILLSLLIVLVAAAIVLIGAFYFRLISDRIFEDSTGHLSEIYGQVNRSFGAFVERNWGLLKSWDSCFALSENADADVESEAEFIALEKKNWGFSDFYFISADGKCMTPDGTEYGFDLSEELEKLMSGESIISGETLPSGREVTVFAVPVNNNLYGGFEFQAIAVSYTNDDLAASLNVDAFSGKAKCFVIKSDGTVLLSTQTGGNVFENYLTYLRAASDLDESGLSKLKSDWESGLSAVTRCKIGEVEHCILYQPVGYQDLILLSAVPESAVSAGFLSVQKITMTVLIVIFLLAGATVLVIIVIQSNKRSKMTRTELQYRELMFDVLSNSVDDIFIMLDSKNDSVDYISPNLERLLGVPVEEARQDIRALEKCAVNFNVVIPRPELEAIPLNENRYWECEYMHQTTGERRWYRMTIYRMMIRDVGKYIVVMSDRTLEQQMNQKLQEALDAARSANEAKSNFLSNMSHDIRTPMNAIVGFSVLLEKDADKPEKVREYTRKITASSHHLLSLINDVLDMSKIESGKTSLNVDRFSLPELLEEIGIIIMPQAKAKNQEFSTRVNGAPPEQLIGDKLRLNQILINILSNAVKYTPEGGKISFAVCEISGAAPQFTKLRFTVSDNGIGMSEEFQKNIFAPFSREINSVTNRIQGTGLGMAITKNLVDLMGGIIELESAPGKGSKFTVELSFSLPEQETGDEWYRQKVSRMLVADDEEDICINIKSLMSGTGVEVSYVTDGLAAVDAAATAHLHGEDFNVILLDWKMPGADGVETARLIRTKVGHDVPILVLTSYDWSDIEDEARSAGINAFMSKPFFVSTFWQTIKPLFAGPAEPETENKPAGENVMNGRLFLVAEDNELNAEILAEMLDMEGAKCEIVQNGLEAVEAFTKSEPGKYDMILMDVQMPVMNGYDATRNIRACGRPDAKTIPIAAMTANTFAEDVKNSMEAGMDGHLAKPIDMNAVRELVGKLLSKNNKPTEGD